MVADPGFAGILKKKMDPRTRQTVTGFIHQNLSDPTVADIRKALAGKIFPGPPVSGKVRVQGGGAGVITSHEVRYDCVSESESGICLVERRKKGSCWGNVLDIRG